MTYCTVTTSRSSNVIGWLIAAVMLVCIAAVIVGVVPSLEVLKTLWQVL